RKEEGDPQAGRSPQKQEGQRQPDQTQTSLERGGAFFAPPHFCRAAVREVAPGLKWSPGHVRPSYYSRRYLSAFFAECQLLAWLAFNNRTTRRCQTVLQTGRRTHTAGSCRCSIARRRGTVAKNWSHARPNRSGTQSSRQNQRLPAGERWRPQ